MAFLRRRLVLMLVACDQKREAEEKRREASELARRLGLRPFLDLLQRDTISTGSLLSESCVSTGDRNRSYPPDSTLFLALSQRV
jgi:hypothetical protein